MGRKACWNDLIWKNGLPLPRMSLGKIFLFWTRSTPSQTKLRIDILALDSSGNVVVVELKRDSSGSGIEWQAIKYASYCSTLKADDLCKLLAAWLTRDDPSGKKVDEEEARRRIKEFTDEDVVGEELENVNQDQRLILVAGEFYPDVVSAILWLREHEVDVRCVQLECFLDADGALLLNPDVIIPLPTVPDIMNLTEPKAAPSSKPGKLSGKQFSLGVENLSNDELEKRLSVALGRDSDLTPRLRAFLELLLSEDRTFGREEIKLAFSKQGIGEDAGQAGRFLSNISQFITKPANTQLRQLITFDGGSRQGQIKDNYRLLPEYRELVKGILSNIGEKPPDAGAT